MNKRRFQFFRAATFSPCGLYRYTLTRYWGAEDKSDEQRNLAVWIGLNPSVAGAEKDDPTMKQIIGFSEKWEYEGCVVVNLFAKIATDPRKLDGMNRDDAVGPDNDAIIKALCRGKPVYVAWGNRGCLYGRDQEVLRLLADAGAELRCLGLTKRKAPRHPLYVPLTTEWQPFGYGKMGTP